MYINLLCMFDNKGRHTLGDMLQGHVAGTCYRDKPVSAYCFGAQCRDSEQAGAH